MICPRRAPSALSRPISAVRWLTATSITFMIRMPATTRLIDAMPASVSVSAVRMPSKVASTASCVMTVTSSSPWWRALSVSITAVRVRGMASRSLDWIRMRNSDSVS